MASALADSTVHPHDRFFFSDGSLYLLVENSLYCLHKFLFEIHATMFPVRELETSRKEPYVLGDVKKIDFDRFLASLYPRTLWVEETKTTQDWISVLGLACKWGFNSLRSRAISKIEQTLDSPIDMVTLGRQYGIPAFLLPGYAVLCQSTTPLSDEEGHRLGMEDVLKIYRIRHELSGITPVPFEVAFAKVKEAGLGDERPGQELDGEQASTWTDVGSIATSQTSVAENEEERGLATLTSDVNPPCLDVAGIYATTLVSERPEQQHIDAYSLSNEPTSVALGNGTSNVPSSVFPGSVSNLDSGPLESDREGLKFLDERTNSNLVYLEIVQWLNTKDIQALHRITQLIVEKAIEAPSENYELQRYPRLCKAMVKYTKYTKYTQMLHRMTKFIVEKAMEDTHRSSICARLCNLMINNFDYDRRLTGVNVDGLSFSECLGEICRENLEAIAASVTVAGYHTVRVRRLRLIEFIGNLLNVGTPVVVDKWVTALLDVDDEEKVATLCMLMTRIGGLCTSLDVDSWLQRVKKIARETSKPRVRELLQGVGVTQRNGRPAMTWAVVEPSCIVQ